MIKKIFWAVLAVTLIVWGGVGVYLLRPIATPQVSKLPAPSPFKPPSVSKESTEAGFFTQIKPKYFVVSGTIKELEEKFITLRGNNGQSGTYPLSDTIRVATLKERPQRHLYLKDLKPGGKVTIYIEQQENDSYHVVLIRPESL